jgi:imidazoleglycerol phosphate synthase glutamine amidotransferase subunit HisH
MEHAPEGWLASTSVYSGRFVAAIERGSLLALQFHPELSGAWGSNVIARWLSEAA